MWGMGPAEARDMDRRGKRRRDRRDRVERKGLRYILGEKVVVV